MTVSVSLTDNTVIGTDLTTYTFTARAVGTASSDRHVIVGAGGVATASRTINSVTVGGSSATPLVSAEANNGVGWSRAGLFIVAFPTGTTADIVVTFSGAMLRAGIGVWSATGLRSTAAFATGSSITDPFSVNLDIPHGGAGVGYCLSWVSGSNPTFTWTGLTEWFDATVEASNGSHSGAHGNFAASQSGLTITADASSNDAGAMVVASFGTRSFLYRPARLRSFNRSF